MALPKEEVEARVGPIPSPQRGGLMPTEALPPVKPGDTAESLSGIPPAPAPGIPPAPAPLPGPAPMAPMEPEEEPEPAGAPVGLIVGGLLVGLLLFVGTCVLAWKVLSRGAGDEESGPSMSYSSAISLLMGRSNAVLASVPGGDPPTDALPVLLTADAVRIRSHPVMELEDGKVPRKDAKGLMVPPLLLVLMAERSDVSPAAETEEETAGGPKALGRGSEALLVLAESDVPFATVARVLYTAESAGFKQFQLGGVSEENSRKVVSVAVTDLDWWPIAEGIPGRGMGVVADSTEGFSIFPRDRGAGADATRKVAKGVSFDAEKLGGHLTELKESRPGTKRVTVQPDARVSYEALVAMLAAARGDGTFERLVLGGGGAL